MSGLPRVHIGEATAPSGAIVLIDFGTLHLWQHARPPIWPADADNPEGDGLVDVMLRGPDAEAAGRALARQWHPQFIYDVGREELPELEQAVQALAQQGYRVTVAPLPRRVPHRQRVANVLHIAPAGVVPFFSMHAVVVGQLPAAARMQVFGVRASADQWRAISLDVEQASVIASRQRVGTVLVDCARLMFADADALGAWNHETSADGMADFLFWGRDAERVAQHFRAPALSDGQFGWRNLALAEAERLGTAIEQAKDQSGGQLKFATDYRPHSDHYRMLEAVRSSPNESGVLDVGGARMCGFMSSVGDGEFPVFAELDPRGRLVRVTVELER